MKQILFAFVTALLSAVAVFSTTATAQGQTHDPAAQKTIVLVHGAFADGSSWNKVIPILEAKGYKAIAVQNPLTSLADDVAYTHRAIEQAEGEVILVGHSWAGVVITEAGNHPKVKSLVYLSAFAPRDGEHIHDILDDAHKVRGIATVPGFTNPIIDKNGYIRLSREDIVKYFAPDIPEYDAKLIAAGQGQLYKDTLDQAVTKAAWKTKPTRYIVTAQDQMIAPDVMRLMGARTGAKMFEIDASHVAMLSKPKEVADIILEAATGK